MRNVTRGTLAAIFLMAAFFAFAEDYLSRDDFLALAFASGQPEMQTFWLTKSTRSEAEAAVGWAPFGLRTRYWSEGQRTAWILEEIGKERPITLGLVIEANKIERVEVLAFRESRGWEIRYPFFTQQFEGLSLADDGYLSDTIDGITGATLSVRAVERVSRFALWAHQRVNK